MTNEEIIEQFQNAIDLIKQNGKDWLDERDIPMLEMAICALKNEKTYGDLISRQAVIDSLYELCDTGESLKENPWRDNPHIDALVETIEQIPSAEKTDGVIAELEKIKESINEIKGDNKYVVSDYMYGRYQAFDIVDDIIADRIAELRIESE